MTTKPSAWKITGMLFMAPIMGAAFCIFLPFIGIAMLVKFGIEKFMRKRYKHLKHFAGVV